jgi:hypothetical protein
MRAATCLVLALLLACSTATAAPTPETEALAKEKLEALKKRMPEVAAGWAKEHWYKTGKVEFRIARLLDTAEARLTFVSVDQGGDQDVLTVYLRYHDGVWYTTRFEASWPANVNFNNKAARFLMLAIDEAAQK